MPDHYEVFIDFDGTITEIDVGYELFKLFTGAASEPLVQRYRIGEINSYQCLAGECEIWNICSPGISDVDDFLKSQIIRKGFGEFVEYLESIDIDPIILSEGFDFYIDKFLNHHGFAYIEKLTNTALYSDGKLTPAFPYFEAGCGSCSNCKGYHIRKIRPPKSCAIFIGDGHSDLHAARAADIVMARSFLGEIMTRNGAAYLPYDNFFDIRKIFEDIVREGVFSYGERLVFKFFSSHYYDSYRDLWENGEVMGHVGYPNGLGWCDSRYERHFAEMEDSALAIFLALEDRSGNFVGEAKIAFPDQDGFCHHDLKLLPRFWNKGLGMQSWRMILERAAARWPDAPAAVTPSVENERAIALYLKLGFRFAGEIETWLPPANDSRAVPVRYRKMIRGGN